jgi:hypothetical protein
MLPREFLEEFFGRPGAAGLHVLQTLPDRHKGLLIGPKVEFRESDVNASSLVIWHAAQFRRPSSGVATR